MLSASISHVDNHPASSIKCRSYRTWYGPPLVTNFFKLWKPKPCPHRFTIQTTKRTLCEKLLPRGERFFCTHPPLAKCPVCKMIHSCTKSQNEAYNAHLKSCMKRNRHYMYTADYHVYYSPAEVLILWMDWVGISSLLLSLLDVPSTSKWHRFSCWNNGSILSKFVVCC